MPRKERAPLPKYMTKRAKKQLPLGKREFEWMKRHGIIKKSTTWEDWKAHGLGGKKGRPKRR